MANTRKSSGRSAFTAGSELSSLSHPYFTRLNAKLRSNLITHSEELSLKRRSSITPNNDFFEDLEDSARFSLSSTGSASENLDFTPNLDRINQGIDNCLARFNRRMDYPPVENPCGENLKKKWMKISVVFLIASIAAWYGNKLRHDISSLYSDVAHLQKTVNNMQDAELDTLYKINRVENHLKDIKQNHDNFKISIQHMIHQEIEKLNTDKTGKTDFALESAGGSIVQLSQGTENYGQPKSSLLGISLCEGTHGPRSIIQKGTSPGECWALKGSSGGVIVRLLGPVKIDAVTMEHISSSISPSGDSSTAPKDFSVWGLKSPSDKGQMLGQFQYDIKGPLVQTFSLPPSAVNVFELVELRIISNQGNSEFTCVYRFRVHGTMDKH